MVWFVSHRPKQGKWSSAASGRGSGTHARFVCFNIINIFRRYDLQLFQVDLAFGVGIEVARPLGWFRIGCPES
jgi:hypothetical protein